MSFTYATVCSGVEGCSLALEGMDWKPIFFSEIEPFPCAVLKSHYPDVPNLGDMSKISYNKEKGIITNGTRTIQFSGRLDLLAGGTPCQDFSVAGKRAGGEKGSGTRSSLCWEWLRLVSELGPRVVLWENVVGCLSSNDGRDFSQFVASLSRLGYCCGWRILDCQYTRVDCWPMAIPQRRRRIWLVGCFGATVKDVAEILFESRSLVGDSAPERIARKAIARIAQNRDSLHAPMVETDCIAIDGDKLKQAERLRNGGSGFGISEDNVGYTLTVPDRHACAYGIGNGQVEAARHPAEELSHTLDCMHDKQAVMIQREVFRADAMQSNAMKSSNPNSGFHRVEVSASLDTSTPTPQKAQGGDMIVECFENHPNDSRITESGDCVQTLTGRIGTGGGNLPLVVGTLDLMGGKTGAHFNDGSVAPTLTHGRGSASDVHAIVSTNSNGGDVMPTINANESKLGGDNQHITGGGTLSVNFEMYDTAEDVNVSLCARRARDCMVVTNESVDVAN